VTHTDPTLTRLLAAVLADPSDDTARLVMADALEEAGDWERGEFIRVQCRLPFADGNEGGAAAPNHPDEYCERCRLRRRERHLFRWGEGRGACGLAPSAMSGYHAIDLQTTATEIRGREHGPTRWRFVWSRGFVSEVRCTLSDFERHAAALFAAQPIERVVLTDKQPSSFDKGVPPFYWFGDGWISSRHDDELPDYLLGIMEELRLGNSFNRPDGAKARTFDASQLALDAASAALVTYGRRLARIDVPCDDCDGSGRTTLGKPLKAGGFDHKCLACGGSGCVLNADH
jgi:uncharacterized protein (TIGR02996 family)